MAKIKIKVVKQNGKLFTYDNGSYLPVLGVSKKFVVQDLRKFNYGIRVLRKVWDTGSENSSIAATIYDRGLIQTQCKIKELTELVKLVKKVRV